MTQTKDIADLPGLVASVCTSGSVTPEFATNFTNLRSHNDRNGLHRIEYEIFDAKLVERGRDAVCRHALENDYEWLLMADGDAAPFAPEALQRLLHGAYIQQPDLDVLGGYAQLRQRPYLPTIDTGTGRWEPQPPGQGIRRVIRTGGHFLLVKTRILHSFGPPWFRSRQSVMPLHALREIDNFARIHLDGTNPLRRTNAWQELEEEAAAGGSHSEPSSVGEDSGFCDRVKAAGGQIGVDTDLIVGHVGRRIIQPDLLKDELREDQKRRFGFVGVRGYL